MRTPIGQEARQRSGGDHTLIKTLASCLPCLLVPLRSRRPEITAQALLRERCGAAFAGIVPGAVRIPRQMLVLRQDALSRSHTKLVAYDSTDARSMQARTLSPGRSTCLSMQSRDVLDSSCHCACTVLHITNPVAYASFHRAHSMEVLTLP